MKALRTTNANTITVGAGDLIGASPLLSGLFHDEPAIEALNILGLDVSGIGNHEFDEGLDEVYRMMNGGCHPVDGCQDGTPFLGSIFGYLAANVFFAGTDETVLPPYEIRKVDNAKIAFIGMTLEGTPLVVTPSAIQGLEFRDEVETANNARREAPRRGGRPVVRRSCSTRAASRTRRSRTPTRRRACPGGPGSTTATTSAARSSTSPRGSTIRST